MPEALSQSQIDELLRAMNDPGEQKAAEADRHATSGKTYRKYNFNNPKKFTKDRLKILSSVYENFARVSSSQLTSLLRMPCEIELDSIEETRFIEFNNALEEKDLLAMFSAKIAESDYDGDPVMIQITGRTLHCMLDRMLGGDGDPEDYGTVGYTDIEVVVFENIVKRFCNPLGDIWQNYFAVKYGYSRSETNPRMVQISNIDDTVVIIVFSINIHNIEGRINICMPGPMLEKMFKIFERPQGIKKDAVDDSTSREIMESIRHSVLDVKATLGESNILLSDLSALNVGDIINLNKHKDSDVVLYIGTSPWFRGNLGSLKQNIAVKIVGNIPQKS